MTSSDLWDEQDARCYDESSAEMFAPALLEPAVAFLARLAGLKLEQRHADWAGAPFTSDSESHVSVWRKPGRPSARSRVRMQERSQLLDAVDQP